MVGLCLHFSIRLYGVLLNELSTRTNLPYLYSSRVPTEKIFLFVDWIFRCKVRPPHCSIGQSSWLQIQRSGFDFRRYRIFWEVVGLERGPLSFVSTVEELLERKSSGSGLENREDGRRDPSRWPRGTIYPQKLALSSPTSGCRSDGIVRSRT
jgi:hypothetical protein